MAITEIICEIAQNHQIHELICLYLRLIILEILFYAVSF
jgi:hypothetical protein